MASANDDDVKAVWVIQGVTSWLRSSEESASQYKPPVDHRQGFPHPVFFAPGFFDPEVSINTD
jgi:hypothetical protein